MWTLMIELILPLDILFLVLFIIIYLLDARYGNDCFSMIFTSSSWTWISNTFFICMNFFSWALIISKLAYFHYALFILFFVAHTLFWMSLYKTSMCFPTCLCRRWEALISQILVKPEVVSCFRFRFWFGV